MSAIRLNSREAAAAAYLASQHKDTVRISWQPGDEGVICEIAGRRWTVTLDGGIEEITSDEASR